MPPQGARGRRGRGRTAWKREATRPPPPAHSRTDTELETQPQQSSNRAATTDTRTDDKPPPLTQTQRGVKRKGRPPSRGRNRGRLSREAPSGQRRGASYGAVAPEAGSERDGGGAAPTGAALGMGRNARRRPDVESEGENDVSEADAAQRRTEPSAVDASLPVEGHSARKAPRREAPPTEYPFAVFTDGLGVTRAERASFILPICVGSIAFWQGKRAPEKKCYRWVVYVRSPGGVDLSHVIRRVKFQLHPSFHQPERYVDQPPYELEETGWGEFEIVVSIELHPDAEGPPVDMTHSLKLYTTSEPSTKRPVVDEKYDEIVFSEPPAAFFQRVRNQEDRRAPLSSFDAFFTRYTSHLVDDCMHKIQVVKSRIRNEVRALLAKAAANGIQIDAPEATKLIEEAQAKDSRMAKESAATGRTEVKDSTELKRKTRIVIDGDRTEAPLKLEREPLQQRPALKAKDEEIDLDGSFLEDLEGSPSGLPRNISHSLMEIEPSERGGSVPDLGLDEVGDLLDTRFLDATPFGLDVSESKESSKLGEPRLYEDVSSCGDRVGPTGRRGSSAKLDTSVKMEVDSNNGEESEEDASPKEDSSFGDASGHLD